MTIRFAVLGTAAIADTQLVPAIAQVPGAVLWSVLSRDLERAGEFASRHAAQAERAAYDDLDELLADPALDAVLMVSPDRLHAMQGIAAACAGKHVLTEKPMACSRDEARALVAACADNQVRLGVAYHLRWHAGHRALARRVQTGTLGELRHMRVMWAKRRADASNWRASSTLGRWWSLAAVGTHCLDLVRWFMRPSCGEVQTLNSVVGHHVFGSENDESAVLALQFENGATAEICTSMVFDAPRRLEIYAEDGYAVCEDTLGPDGAGSIRIETANESQALSFNPVNPYAGEIADFVAAIEQGRPAEVDGVEGARNVSLLLQAVGDFSS
ncbi:MAG: Gfo/Idh/MocA family oxidoreductase [Gammaproteobacteria bacterium]|nr:Gfo/Idh/MocA family oxidoreductase [Gammaproteobacteria bacterium]